MISDLKKLIKIIRYSKLKKINLLFLLIFLNSVIEVLSIGILLPIVGLIVSPEFYDSFQKFFFEKLNFDFFQVNNLSKKNFSLILIIFAIFLYFIKFLINAVYSWVLQSTKINYENFIGTTILNNLTRTSSLDFLSLPASKLLNDMNQRISMVSNSIVYISNIGVEIIILCIVSFILLYKYPLLTFIILILFLSISLILYYSWKKKIFNWSKQRGVAGEKRNRNLLDYFNGIREVLLYSSNNLFLIEFIKLNKKYLGSQKKILFLNSLPRIFLELIFIFSALGIIYYYVLNDLDYNKILFSLSFGLIIVIRLLPSVNRLISNINYFKFSSDSIFHVYKLLQMTISTDKDIKKITFEKKITLLNIDFNHSEKKKIFKDLNFTIKKNSKVGIVGKTGSGKTTLVDLIAGLIKPTSGEVFADTIKVDQNFKAWSKNISYVPQEVFLFNLSIRQNITFRADSETIDEVKFSRILKLCNLYDFIISQKEKEFTIINEDGNNVSGGQRQRIGIARALYKNANILILDESTNALDEESEKIIVENILSLKEKTVIFITHNVNNLERFDKILKIKNNQLSEIKK